MLENWRNFFLIRYLNEQINVLGLLILFFFFGGREGVKKIVVLLIGEDNFWSDKVIKVYVQEVKDNYVFIFVIIIGNKNFIRLYFF